MNKYIVYKNGEKFYKASTNKPLPKDAIPAAIIDFQGEKIYFIDDVISQDPNDFDMPEITLLFGSCKVLKFESIYL